MTSPRLTLSLHSTTTADPWWVRVVQEDVADDSASLADAAVLIDTLYNLDPCDDGATTATEDPDSDTTDTVVETEIESVACLYDENGDVDVVLQVIRSAIDAEYKLALQGGELKSVETIRETITLILVVEDLSSLTLEYPVLGNFSATWRGAVYGSSGVIAPPIKRRGNTLDFGATVKAGTISATFTTEYDRCTVTVLGDNGQPGACTARVFYHGLVEELELELPEASEEIGSCQVQWTVPQDRDQIECYRTVYVSRRCQCSPDELDFYTYEEVVSCPDSVIRCPGVLNECRHYLGTVVAHEYVECASDMVEAVSHPAYYKKMCCQEPSVTLPQCKEQKTSWRGGLPIKGGAQQYYDLYGKDLEIIPVGPPGGICGIWTKKQQILSNNCCDGVPPLIWDTSVSPEVVAPNSSVVIGVTGGGKYPYRWSVVGTGFWFQNGSKGIETDGPQVRLVASSGACGSAIITVTDGCTACVGLVRSTSGKWTDTCYVLQIEATGPHAVTVYREAIIADGGCSLDVTPAEFGGYHDMMKVTAIVYRWVGKWNQADGFEALVDAYATPESLEAAKAQLSIPWVPDVTALTGPTEAMTCPQRGPCAWVCP